ncbi:MAG: hypothetical protein A2Z69_02320 [Bacteroidetes bacterium RBG_13_44_24]|nr:MAG: hypothetical protein A2Z69_02320 [Bacteroidetes bacterium RBG_13_44_24]
MSKKFWLYIKISQFLDKLISYYNLKVWDILYSHQPQTVESLEDLYKRLPPGYIRFRVLSWIDTLKKGENKNG